MSIFAFIETKNGRLIQRIKQIPLIAHVIYFMLSVTVCFLYFQKVVAKHDFFSANSISAVATFATSKPFQFRLLIPVLFKIFSPISFVSVKILFAVYSCIIVYLLLVVYYVYICEIFKNSALCLLLATAILYPITWNYILLNESFQYYDFTAILFFTLGLYFISRDNFKWLLVTFIFAILNKESAVYLIFSYLLFNYNKIFTKKIIFNTAILGIVFIIYKVLLAYIFRNNPGGNYEIGLYVNIDIMKNLLSNRVFAKNLGLNFGLLYVFAILLFVTGKWRLFENRGILFSNLTIIPYFIIGIYTVYFTEVRVYTELIPLFTTLFLIYIKTLGVNNQVKET